MSHWLKLEIFEDSETELNVRIYDPEYTNFRLPYRMPFPFTKVNKTSNVPNKYSYTISNLNEIFNLHIFRLDTGETIFDTSVNSFIFSKYYIELGTLLTSDYFYGMGERR